MKLWSDRVAALGLVLCLTTSAWSQESIPSSEYFPLKLGTTWRYKVNNQKITITVAKYEKRGDVLCARLETSANGKVVATEHIAVGKDGLYRHAFNEMAVDPPVCFLKLPYVKNQTWKVNSKIGNQVVKLDYTTTEEMVTVPAGTYKAIVAKTSEFQDAGLNVQVTLWFAKDIGMVKTIIKTGDVSTTVQLEKFEAGK